MANYMVGNGLGADCIDEGLVDFKGIQLKSLQVAKAGTLESILSARSFLVLEKNSRVHGKIVLD